MIFPKQYTIVLILLALIFVASSSPVQNEDRPTEVSRAPRNKPLNTSLLDRINIDNYLKNERAVRQQIKCILRNGPCDSVGNIDAFLLFKSY